MKLSNFFLLEVLTLTFSAILILLGVSVLTITICDYCRNRDKVALTVGVITSLICIMTGFSFMWLCLVAI